MTTHEVITALRQFADALEELPPGALVNSPGKPTLSGEYAVGAALLLRYLRDLLTLGEKDQFTRDELLVMLEITSRDRSLFPGDPVALFDMIDKQRPNGGLN